MPLEAKNISFRYDRKEPFVLKDISLRVERGERVALFAPSGYGKTTLVKLMSGYLEPTEGQILLDGKALPKKGSLSYGSKDMEPLRGRVDKIVQMMLDYDKKARK